MILTAGGVFIFFILLLRKNRTFHKIHFYFANNIYGATFVLLHVHLTMEHKENYYFQYCIN